MQHIQRHTFFALAFLALGLFAPAPKAHAAVDDHHLVISTVSLHFKNSDERNTLTPGIGWEYSPSQKLGFHLGSLSDSFGYQGGYAGVNYATRSFRVLGGDLRFLLGATFLHKQFHKNSDPETKLLPLPAVELAVSDSAVINISGSPQVDYAGQRNNAVLFFQLKLNLL